ncbi:hypothetical protein B0J18DRAFT_214630 [Chaetomium sp. MPI-SDFR-AT-0129]|nr:hypothetical protein B0J18DRAFT_214630 [Chaetomium sp. MPI-SDFR-AT-0129]
MRAQRAEPAHEDRGCIGKTGAAHGSVALRGKVAVGGWQVSLVSSWCEPHINSTFLDSVLFHDSIVALCCSAAHRIFGRSPEHSPPTLRADHPQGSSERGKGPQIKGVCWSEIIRIFSSQDEVAEQGGSMADWLDWLASVVPIDVPEDRPSCLVPVKGFCLSLREPASPVLWSLQQPRVTYFPYSPSPVPRLNQRHPAVSAGLRLHRPAVLWSGMPPSFSVPSRPCLRHSVFRDAALCLLYGIVFPGCEMGMEKGANGVGMGKTGPTGLESNTLMGR